MTIRECYESIGADFEVVFARMMKKEALVEKFAKKFLNDKSYSELLNAFEVGDADAAFRAAHTLKGVTMNLGFSNMYQPVSALTEIFRGGTLENAEAQLQELKEEYRKTIAALQQVP